MKKISNQHCTRNLKIIFHFRVFGNFFAAPETIIFKISYLHAVSSPHTAGFAFGERSRGYSRPESAPETTNFTLEPAPETHLFTLKPARARARDPPFLDRFNLSPMCSAI